MKSIELTITATGYIIVITTDTACHLWMRYTTIEPKEHMIPVIRRGVAFRSDKYFCFDSYHDNEQDEPGDTLTHTFTKEPWPVCETRYFYFHGEIAGVASKSTTAIFNKHRGEPPVTAEFYPDKTPETTSVDGCVGHNEQGLTWPQLRASAGSFSSHVSVACTERITSAYYERDLWAILARGILLFDTSIIPPTASILAASINLYCSGKYDALNTEPDMVIVSSNPFENTSLRASDFATLGDTPLSNAISYTDFIYHAYNLFTLNAAGLSQIAKAAITKLGTREYTHDLLGNEPNNIFQKQSYLSWHTAEVGALKRPILTVTYEP